MIMVGLNYRWGNAAGASTTGKFFFEAKDYHEAAVETLKTSWSNPWQVQMVIGGEFHDTSTHRTWSVDSGGHTKKDYRKESQQDFIKRWRGEIA